MPLSCPSSIRSHDDVGTELVELRGETRSCSQRNCLEKPMGFSMQAPLNEFYVKTPSQPSGFPCTSYFLVSKVPFAIHEANRYGIAALSPSLAVGVDVEGRALPKPGVGLQERGCSAPRSTTGSPQVPAAGGATSGKDKKKKRISGPSYFCSS